MKGLALVLVACTAMAAADVGTTLPPVFTPPDQTGVIRIWGHPSLAPVVDRWREGFLAQHPNLRIEVQLTGSDIAMAGLYTGQADLALLGRDATPSEIQAFEWVYQYKPSRLGILTGSFDQPGKSAALSVIVQADNPLTRITLQQLDAAFSFERRRAGSPVRTWGDLGLAGGWQDAPLNLYTFDTESGTGRFFREAALLGSRHLNWDRLREFGKPDLATHATLAMANIQLLEALANDPLGLAVAVHDARVVGVKALALADCEICPPFETSRAGLVKGTYPLTRSVSAYFNAPPNQPADRLTMAFLEYIRSRTGQAAVSDADGYLPLLAPIDG